VKPVDFHPDAKREAEEAARRYQGLREGLGEDFRAELTAALTIIQETPEFYAVERGSIRLAPLHRFPYGVLYEELLDRIWIAAVAHHSRRPGYWARRRRH
jgi:hypothetical protein